jgi:8-oxo-dGTP diphosphatase
MKSYVVGFLFDDEAERVVLIRKRKPAWQAGRLNGVGGKIEEGETPLVAMIREYEEEAGAFFEDWERYAVLNGPNYIVHVFRGFNTQVLERSSTKTIEEIEIKNSITPDVLPNLQFLIPLAINSNDVILPVQFYYGETKDDSK